MPIWDDPLSPTLHWARDRFLLRFYDVRHFWMWLTKKPRLWKDCGQYGEHLSDKQRRLYDN